jgi:DNA-binding response OmpR family regulator
LLRMRGMRPILAPTGAEGLQMAREQHPELILLDLMLPDTNGFEVCRHLRAHPETVAIPIVMVTAMGGDESRLRGFWVGANAYVTKPYAAQDLYDAIAKAGAWKDDLRREQIRGEIFLELNSAGQFLQEVNTFLEGQFAMTPLDTDQIEQMRQAVLEMGQNAIEWGNRHRSEQLVDITYRIHADRVEIVIRDQGSGFDRSKLDHAASPEDPIAHMDVREKLGLREGGFGLLITDGMVDEMRHNDVGNEVTLVKRFLPARTEPAQGAEARTDPA